jgi:hypothetical protein
MASLFGKRKKPSQDETENEEQKASTISKLLDDITTLEINTIIKDGMTAAHQPESIEDTLRQLFVDYIRRMNLIINKYGFKDEFNFSESKTVESFHRKLKDFRKFLLPGDTKPETRIDENDYIRLLRMLSFCEYLELKSERNDPKNCIKIKPYAEGLGDNIYVLDMSDSGQYRLIMDVRDRVKIKRMYDLGLENIVLQTRFGLDGDVVTRIGKDFADHPQEVVLKIHDNQTNLTVNYWKSLVTLVKDFVSEFFK